MGRRRTERKTSTSASSSPLLRLPSDLIKCILAHLNLRDHIRVGASCKALRLHAIVENPPVSKPLCLVPGLNNRRLMYIFFFGRSPPDPTDISHIGAIGFLGGWVVVLLHAASRTNLHLFHRIKGTDIVLPWRRPWEKATKAVLSAEPSPDGDGRCFVAVLYDSFKLAVCKLRRGSQKWSNVNVVYPRRWQDLAFHQGRLWVLFVKQDEIVVSFFDMEAATASLKLSTFLSASGSFHWDVAYLVNSGSKLLAVAQEDEGFVVWDCTSTGLLVQSHLDGRALLLRYMCGENEPFSPNAHNISVSLVEMRMLEEDCIYFHDFDYTISVYKYDSGIGKFACAGKLFEPQLELDWPDIVASLDSL